METRPVVSWQDLTLNGHGISTTELLLLLLLLCNTTTTTTNNNNNNNNNKELEGIKIRMKQQKHDL